MSPVNIFRHGAYLWPHIFIPVMMQGCIAGCQYMPSAEFFAHWLLHGPLTLEQHEHYQKRTWRNKTAILGKDKPVMLTVPLRKGKHQQLNICKVLISYDEPWTRIHLESFKTAYGKTAFFDEVLPELERIYGTEYSSLWALNMECIRMLTSLLGGQWNLNLSETFIHQYPPPITDLRAGVPAGSLRNNEVSWPSYPQVLRIGKTHLPNLCILDALCHLGPETTGYLKTYAQCLYATAS